jgi:DNA-binding transcriptional regulator YiaG
MKSRNVSTERFKASSVYTIYRIYCGIYKSVVDFVKLGIDIAALRALDCGYYRRSKQMSYTETLPSLGVAESASSQARRFSELGARILRLRTGKGWERTELARELGVSRDRVSKWERGENAPPLEFLVPLAILLEVTLDELVTGKPWAGDAPRVEKGEP